MPMPEGHVAVYQPWLKYYECFEVLKKELDRCKECADSDPYGTCYSPSNYSRPGCLCPKQLSTPAGKGAKRCSRHHVTVSCGNGLMEVTFDPGYPKPPYNELLSRLRSGDSIAYIDGYRQGPEASVCQLREASGGKYKAELRLDSDTACGGRAVTVTRQSHTANQKVLKATLRVLWNRNFYTYPDIVVGLMCTVTAQQLGYNDSMDSKIKSRTGQQNPSGWDLPPKVISGLALWLRVLNRSGFSVSEIEEEDPIQLEILLRDTTDGYTRLLVKQCTVAAAPRTKSTGSTKLIDCGGSAVPKSGFNASFQSPRQGTGLHLQQTGSFPAFRLGGSLPTVYFACTVRICQESESIFCDPKTACKPEKMTKRSPDFGVRELDEEIRLVVIAKHQAKRSEISDAVCKYSMCLSTSQVIIIILILLVLLALLSGLIIVVYRRRIIMSAARRLRMSGSAGANAGNDEDTPMQTPIDAIGKGPPTCLHHGNQQAGYHQHCGHPGGYRQQQHCTTLPRIPLYSAGGCGNATPADTTLDSGLGNSVRAYASMTLDRNGAAGSGRSIDI
ncbi:hypothetical protein BOX15_Mlig017528g1 [Macrostomum lignano]|uniref:ZP domain-containing protein n=1 Tax=Macrostomum lignano TaxID=282301 RepID=A0A267DL16_9PLAT|nr:hypothetical protein BOX15_Mlig017528g1 [Macrostomum lignano]